MSKTPRFSTRPSMKGSRETGRREILENRPLDYEHSRSVEHQMAYEMERLRALEERYSARS